MIVSTLSSAWNLGHYEYDLEVRAVFFAIRVRASPVSFISMLEQRDIFIHFLFLAGQARQLRSIHFTTAMFQGLTCTVE